MKIKKFFTAAIIAIILCAAYLAAQVSKDQARKDAEAVSIKATPPVNPKSYKSPTF